jgi:hypothetical protein
MRAIDKFYEENRNDVNWINILSGQQVGTLDLEHHESFGVSRKTLRAQLRKDSFYTAERGECIMFARRPFKYFS